MSARLFRIAAGALLCLGGLHAQPSALSAIYQGTFPRPDAPVTLERASGISVDSRGTVYVVDPGRHQLLTFAPDGRFLESTGGFGQSAEQFDGPRDVFAQTTLDVYVADYHNNRVVRFDKNLNYLNDLTARWPEPYDFFQVLSVAVSSQYDLFLLEDGNKTVIRFSRSSQPTAVFGGINDPVGQLLEPHQLAVQGSRRVFVSDPGQGVVVIFDYLGSYLGELRHPELNAPTGLHWGDDEQLYVVDGKDGDIGIFNDALKWVGMIRFPAGKREPWVDCAVHFARGGDATTLYALAPDRVSRFLLASGSAGPE